MDSLSFVTAAHKGDIEAIQRMLGLGVDPNLRTDSGDVAILAAASRGHYPIVEVLLKRGANPNLRSGSNSALSCAVSRRDRDIFYLLLDRVEQLKPETLCYALEVALSNDTVDLADALLKAGANINNTTHPETVLFNLVNKGHPALLMSLIAAGVNLDARNFRGETALMRLASSYTQEDNTAEALALLLNNVANPFESDRDGFSALTRASHCGNEQMIKAFAICDYSLTETDANGITPLEVAVDAGQYKIVEILLEAGVSPNVTGRDGQSPLLRAVTGTRYQSKEVINVLIQYGADTKSKDKDGYTALERAVQSRQKNVAQQIQQLEPNLFGENIHTVKEVENVKSSKVLPKLQHSAQLNGEKVSVQGEAKIVSAEAELRDMIGLKQAKIEVSQIIASLTIQKLRKKNGLSTPEQNLNMILTGNPGTGKTTVARLVAKIYKDLAVLDKGHLVKIDRVGLISAHISDKLERLIQSAIGGILYIDRAYTNVNHESNSDQNSSDAVISLLDFADKYRNNLVVIVAGYTEPMQKFIKSNPGLQSRFNKFLHFDDYAPAELTEIFGHFAAQGDYKLHPATELKLFNVFTELYARRDETFGNARLARNLFEKAINAHANRMVSAGMMDEASLVTLYPEDVPAS